MALDQKYIDDSKFKDMESKVIETSRMLSGLINYLKQSEFKGSRFK